MCNLTAGTGTPYWYEWSVGLLYAVKMLNPDNQIKNVVLQSDESQSLDDVVVTYENGTKEYIQVKHTRENDKLSFSDMVEGELKKSYLYKYSSEWKDMEEKNLGNNKVIFFTNRKMGERKYTPDGGWQRPPLSSFWKNIKNQVNELSDADSSENVDVNRIIVNEEWDEAWKIWKECMGNLNDKEKFYFLKNFDLITDQEDLDGMIDIIADELQKVFGTTHEIAVGLHQKLCYQLLWWSTSIRDKKEIEKEDVMQALSLSGDEIKGEHILPLCEPFFKSRIEFVKCMEQKILNGKSRVTFLTGNPGCGKTNIISYLACKPDSIITLRFHAFKPIIPGELYISADSGISDQKEFWGSLLIMLRELFKGKLYEYRVPVSIELIDSVDRLRAEVMRLSTAWAEITGKPTVIAIDGIDHAARSGEKHTFLQTLLPPEAVPVNVRFILAGQPVYQFSEYPDFLSDAERIEMMEVPDIQKEDLELMYDSNHEIMRYDELGKNLVINYIADIAKGNTLSAVFAMQEASKYDTFDDYEKNSNVKVLSSGIQSYYEYIWRGALEQAGDIGYIIDMYLAAAFSIINRKISANLMREIFGSDISVWQWKNTMQNLFPIIKYDKFGYSVFHNDVRIYLASHYKKAKQLIPEISGKIADFLVENEFDAKIKHELVFKLLKDAGRINEYVDVFTSGYVIEAYALKRNPREIQQQMLSTLESLVSLEDKRKIVKFSCAVTTMLQHKESLNWLDMKYEYETEIPFALESERRVIPDTFLTIDDVLDMFADVKFLTEHGKQNRAKCILERWMGMRTPKTILALFEKKEKNQLDDIMEIWGKYARMFQVAPGNVDYVGEDEKRSAAQFYKGWLSEAENHYGIVQIKYTLKNLSCHYVTDIEDYFQCIIRSNRSEDIEYILQGKIKEKFSEYNQLAVCVWAVRNYRIDLCEEWLQDIANKEFTFISDKWIKRKFNELDREKERFKIIASIMYVLSYVSTKKLLELRKSALEKSEFEKDNNDKIVAENLLTAISYIAYMEQCILMKCTNRINLEDFKVTLDIILEEKYYNGCFRIETILFRKGVLESIIRLNDMLPQSFTEILEEKLCEKAKTFSEVMLFESYWSYLCACNKIDLVEKYFDEWMGFDGIIWSEELSEREYISRILLKVAEKMGWQEKLNNALKLLNARSIGYVGRKDYSLFSPLNWFERIANDVGDVWESEGCLLLNLSEYASKIGDNRAFVQIGGSVAAVAGKMGANSLLQFVNMIKKSEIDWRELAFDGIISALETNYFTEEELFEIWKKAISYFPLNEYAGRYDNKNMRRKIYCADIHEAITLCAKRLKYDALEDKMSKMAPLEYAQERLEQSEHSCRIPSRWYESEYYMYMDEFMSKTKKMTLDEMFDYIEVQFNKGEFYWDYIKYFIQKAKSNNPRYIIDYKPRIMKMLEKREINNLDYDGCNRLYAVLFPYLNDGEVINVLEKMIDTYYHQKSKGWTSTDYGLMNDLDNFTFALFSRFPVEDNIWGLHEILKMHCLWLSGTENLEVKEIYHLEEVSIVENWCEFFNELEKLCEY